jgi:undecaprenyl-diphosphatase
MAVKGNASMDILPHLKAALMGLVEGLTEFLPVSSTGHLIMAGDLLHFDIPSRDVFIIAIQAAAILAVCWEYRARLLRLAFGIFSDARERRLAVNIVVAFLPAALLGVAFKSMIEKVLFRPLPVALAFFVGGAIIILVEKHVKGKPARAESIDDISWRDALKIGLFQCLALIPGTRRSGATVIGALLAGLSRRAAAEFSFFLAIPTIAGATVFSLWKARHDLAVGSDGPLYLTASVFSFLAAFACVRWFLKYISTHDFTPFAWYRMAAGAVILLTAWTGIVVWP